MTVIERVFPKYTAAAAQAAQHATQATAFVKAAVTAPNAGERLDNAVRAANSFDHAVTAANDLPLHRIVPRAGQYAAGYQAAKAVVNLIVGSGIVPGAATRVGRNEIAAARDEYAAGIERYTAANDTRYDRFRAVDWVRSALEDAAQGVRMLRRDDLSRPLLRGITQTRTDMTRHQDLSDANIRQVQDLLNQATTAFDALLAQAEHSGTSA